MLKKSLTLLICITYTTLAYSQVSSTNWMLENNVFGYKYNPASIAEKSFFSVGSANVGVRSDLGVSNIIFPTDNGLVTGLNSAISEEDFLKGMRDLNRMEVDINENIIATGFRKSGGGYSVLELNLRANVFSDIPKDAFRLLKGSELNSYDLSDFKLGTSAYAEFAYSYSKKVREKFSYGFRIKALCGIARLGFDVKSARAQSCPEKIEVNADANFLAACSLAEIGLKESQYDAGTEVMDFENISFDYRKIMPNGAGAAIDLGIKAELFNGFELGISVSDLGIMAWNYNIMGRTDADFVYEGEKFSASEDGNSAFGQELHGVMNTLESLTEFKPEDAPGWKSEMLPFNVNAAVKWYMPFYQRLSFGATGNYRHSRLHNSYDARIAAAITPVNWFSLTANIGHSSFGTVSGLGLSINASIINFFVVADTYVGRMAHYTADNMKIAIPYPIDRFACNVNFGLNILYGKRLSRFTEMGR